MKKSILSLMIVFLSLVFVPAQVKAAISPADTTLPAPIPTNAEKAEILLSRINEIKSMDKSDLSFSEKRELRKEVRSTKKVLRELNGGVYLSVGAIILIALLLIILL